MTRNGKHTFDQLVSGYCDQSLTAPEFARLDELLAASPDLRQRFMQLTALHGSLAWVCAARDERLADGAPPPVLKPRRWLRTAGVLLGMAAALLVALYFGRPIRPVADGDQPSARIVELSGSGELLRPDGPVAPLALHQELVVGQTLRLADADATAVVEYCNGTRLHLGAGTTMHLLASPAPAGGAAANNKVFLGAGVVRAEAAQLAAASLILATPHAEVLGTTFTCSVGAEATRVELEEGRAQLVRQADGKAVELVPGSYAVSTADISADLAPRKLVNEVLIPRGHVRLSGPALALSLDGQRLATVSQNQFTFWNTRTGQSEFSLPTRRTESACVAFAPDGRTLAASGPEGAVVCWDLPLRSERRRWAATSSVQSLAYSTDGRWLAWNACQASRTPCSCGTRPRGRTFGGGRGRAARCWRWPSPRIGRTSRVPPAIAAW